MEDHERVRGTKDVAIELQLAEINERLAGMFEQPGLICEYPIVLIIGHQRSGSTLVNQYITSTFEVGYPSNLIARFWRAPLAGLAVQQAVARHLDPPDRTRFRSELGSTEGLLEPHEFSYFWNHWFPGEVRCRDPDGFVRAIAGLAAAFDAPLVFKNVFNLLRVELLARLLPTAVFVRIRRNLLDVAASTLQARRHRFGTEDAWIGPRAPALDDIAGMTPAEQIAAQLHYSEQAMAPALAALPTGHVIDLSYEQFCAAPDGAATQLLSAGLSLRPDRRSLAPFESSRPAPSEADRAALEQALRIHFTDSEVARGSR